MADKYTLPELPYDYSALEPHISGKIMEIHHDKHHNTYVNGANSALEKLAEARENDDFGAINQYTRDLSFNLGGHINHSIFWKGLSPDGGGTPQGDLADAIKQDFGSFEAFQKQFTNVATGVQGSGWAVLAYDTVGKRLVTFQLYDQANTVPLRYLPDLPAGYVGARLLPGLPQREGRLCEGHLEHRQLGRSRQAPRGDYAKGRGYAHPLIEYRTSRVIADRQVSVKTLRGTSAKLVPLI